MGRRRVIIDGMLSGTGLRDGDAGGYLDAAELGLSATLAEATDAWLSRYEEAHYRSFSDLIENDTLDADGIALAKAIQAAHPELSVSYFSNAKLKHVAVDGLPSSMCPD